MSGLTSRIWTPLSSATMMCCSHRFRLLLAEVMDSETDCTRICGLLLRAKGSLAMMKSARGVPVTAAASMGQTCYRLFPSPVSAGLPSSGHVGAVLGGLLASPFEALFAVGLFQTVFG